MKTTLYNKQTSELVNGIFYKNGYAAKYPEGTLPNHIIELELINTPAPSVDSMIEKLEMDEWLIDVENKKYIKQWKVVDLTDVEIAQREWVHPRYAKRLRVIDNKALKMQMANVLLYWDEEGMPRDVKDGYIRLWCQETLSEHQAFIDSANEWLAQFGEQVHEEDRPEILNFENDESHP